MSVRHRLWCFVGFPDVTSHIHSPSNKGLSAFYNKKKKSPTKYWIFFVVTTVADRVYKSAFSLSLVDLVRDFAA